MQQEFVNGWWQIKLDDGSVVARSGEHCCLPNTANGFLFYSAAGPNSHAFIARNLSTGQEQELSDIGGNYKFVTDGRYAAMLSKFLPLGDKQADFNNLVCSIFDTQTRTWLDFSASRPFNPFGTLKPWFLWVKQWIPGGAADPGTYIRDYGFASPGSIVWTTVEGPWNRTIDLATGTMGAIG